MTKLKRGDVVWWAFGRRPQFRCVTLDQPHPVEAGAWLVCPCDGRAPEAWVALAHELYSTYDEMERELTVRVLAEEPRFD